MIKDDKEYFVYVGTYTSNKGDGIYVFKFDITSGALKFVDTIETINPSYLAIHPHQHRLYAVNEISDFKETDSGSISSFAIDSSELKFMNKQSTQGSAPCYVSFDNTGQYVFAANYGGGSITVFPVDKEGYIGKSTDFIQHQGSSVDPERQEGPHAHSIRPGIDNRKIFTCDLGLDKVLIYNFDFKNGKFKDTVKSLDIEPGSGPRHLSFYPDGKYVYIINELNSTIAVFKEENDSYSFLQSTRTIPENFTGTNYCADIHYHPTGKFLYGSNRGHNSIVIYEVNENTGMLNCSGWESTLGKTPRNFCIDPGGKFLLAANQDSNNIKVFKIDQETGKLNYTGKKVEVSSPVCLKMIPV